MSSMMPAGRTLWDVVIVYDAGARFVRKKLSITSEKKEFAFGYSAVTDYLALHANRFPRAEIKQIKYAGVIHA